MLTCLYSNFEYKTKTAVEVICQSDSFPLQYNIANIIHKYKAFDNYLPTLSSLYSNSFNRYLTWHSKLKTLQKTDMVSKTAALCGSNAVVKLVTVCSVDNFLRATIGKYLVPTICTCRSLLILFRFIQSLEGEVKE